MISRSQAAELAREVLRILAEGAYTAPSGRAVPVGASVEAAVRGTVSYPPETSPSFTPVRRFDTEITVTAETTLAAARRLVLEGEAPVALNFASAKNPGGGFLSGARAQEESIARSSALIACLDGNPMYAFHRARRDAMYTHYALYSPAVPVFREDSGALLETPYPLAVVTSPAPNAGAVLDKDRRRANEIGPALSERIDKVLHVGAAHGHEAIILGAWGCGAFRGDPVLTADLFAEALEGKWAGVYRRVVFAVFDPSKGATNFRAFEQRLIRRTARAGGPGSTTPPADAPSAPPSATTRT